MARFSGDEDDDTSAHGSARAIEEFRPLLRKLESVGLLGAPEGVLSTPRFEIR
jgi:hypothetical protein